MNTTLYQNRPEDTQNWTNLYIKPHDYRVYYVNINLRHQYGISVAESQTFLHAKRPQRRRVRRNRCFHRLSSEYSSVTLHLSLATRILNENPAVFRRSMTKDSMKTSPCTHFLFGQNFFRKAEAFYSAS